VGGQLAEKNAEVKAGAKGKGIGGCGGDDCCSGVTSAGERTSALQGCILPHAY
jgi:hypothetical protein